MVVTVIFQDTYFEYVDDGYTGFHMIPKTHQNENLVGFGGYSICPFLRAMLFYNPW